MLHSWAVVTATLFYFGLLFAVATFGDRKRPSWMTGRARPFIFSFSIAVYCTAMTFFGSIGLAVRHGLEFSALYVGPILVFALGSPLLTRLARIARSQNITSVADFISARYGKSQSLATLVTIGAVIGVVPYISVQLRAISQVVGAMLEKEGVQPATLSADLPLVVALVLAVFAILFGTRRVNASESQHGLMLAVAMESVLKLLAFLTVGIFVTWFMFNGPDDLIERAAFVNLLGPFEQMPRPSIWVAVALISVAGTILLPRQFHVTIVENTGEQEMRYAAWLVPVYMIAINLFVVPLAIAGMLMFGDGSTSPDLYVVTLPLSAGANSIAMVAFVGGLSAATTMVIVEAVALAIMVSNNLVFPLMVRRQKREIDDVRGFLLVMRRLSILGILLLAFAYQGFATTRPLVQTGLISFAAIAQFAPAFFGGMIWRRATARGALLAIGGGLAVWGYTLLLPSFGPNVLGDHMLSEGPLGLGWLRPQALFGLNTDPLVNGVFWSLAVNLFAYVAGSLSTTPSPLERLQANAFIGNSDADMAQSFRGWHAPISVGELRQTLDRYLGDGAVNDALRAFEQKRNTELADSDKADVHLLRYAEHLLAGAIGTSSSRLVLSLLLRHGAMSKTGAIKLLDDASMALQYSRDLLQTAMDHAHHGMVVLDQDMTLVCWNREYARIFSIPPELLKVGTPVDAIMRSIAVRGIYGPGSVDEHLAERMERISGRAGVYRTVVFPTNRVIETRIDGMPDGGLVGTFTDVTETVEAERALEERVNERTRELVHLNQELSRAKAAADTANFSKTRFLAAASHDILQPLNAARLYVSSLAERADNGPNQGLVGNIDAALQSVEEIFSTLLDISRLDAGALKPDISTFQLGDVLRALELEFTPLATAKDLRLTIRGGSYWVTTDRRLLRRVLQNLVSNAVKYTPRGRVLVGCRRRGSKLVVEVCDTGLGIAPSKQKLIFREFQRLESGARVATGLGLGLSIVERITRVLDLPLKMHSVPERGSSFRVEVPRAEPPEEKTLLVPASSTPPGLALTGMRILCIDNEPAILEGMQILLTGWGCVVHEAPTLQAALLKLQQFGAPDVVIADYHLDHGDGIEAVGKIRREIERDIPAILITADRGAAVREAANRDGITVLHKPLRPASLRALLGQYRLARSAAE
jgi:Na+/proline symporter/signal transduction histidine kinase/CheY-like chemotaxis protein